MTLDESFSCIFSRDASNYMFDLIINSLYFKVFLIFF